MLIQLSALIIFWSAVIHIGRNRLLVAGSEQAPLHFIKTGPFRFIRHPFYATYLLSYFGTFVATQNLLLLVLLMLIAHHYYKNASEEEQFFSLTVYAQEYVKYKNKTGMFFPKLKAASKNSD